MAEFDADYFVPNLWLKDTFNLVAGASGSGKTRWMLPQLIELKRAGLEILYTCCDRPIRDGQRTLVKMGYPADALPMLSFQEESESTKFDVKGLHNLAKSHRITLGRKVDILYVESITILAGDPNKAVDVVNFSRQIINVMRYEGCSIWGSSWVSKVKEGAQFVNTRDNVMGSAAWPGICGTMAVITSPNGEMEPERDIQILLRDGKPRLEHYKFNDRGILELYEPPSMDDLLKGGGRLLMSDITAQAKMMGRSERWAYKWKDMMLESGRLVFVRKGVYQCK
jgi:hypothetical protein